MTEPCRIRSNSDRICSRGRKGCVVKKHSGKREAIIEATGNVLESAKDVAYAMENPIHVANEKAQALYRAHPAGKIGGPHRRRMRIVAWLRVQGFSVAADGIERGEHLK